MRRGGGQGPPTPLGQVLKGIKGLGGHPNTQTNIVTYRLNRPRGVYIMVILNLSKKVVKK